MFNKINIEVLIQIVVEFFLSLLLAVNLYNGNINKFVHPKFNVVIALSALYLMISALISTKNIFKPKHMYVLNRYFVISLPIILSFFISANIADVSKSAQNDSDESITMSYNNADTYDTTPQISQYKKTEYKKEKGKDYINIEDDMYLKWYYDSTFKWKDYKDEKFRFLARVFKDTGNKNFVVLGRLGMICCAADVQPCGFLYMEKGYDELKDGKWYIVTGKISENKKYSYNYQKIPIIEDVKLEPVSAPVDQYVYLK